MIVAAASAPGNGASLRVITQNDHAHLAARILGLWTTHGLPEHPRRQQLLIAAREHDNGWQEADSAPSRREADGRPVDFLTISTEQRLEIWNRGTLRHANDDPEVALLIVQHALRLHSRHFVDAEWQPALQAWADLRTELLEGASISVEALAADYRWIDLVDALSLALCSGWQRTLALGPWRVYCMGDVLEIDPFPLAGATTLTVPSRTIPDHRFENATELAVALAVARWEDHSVRLRPFSRT